MNGSLTHLSQFRTDIVKETHLGQLCGSHQRFRDRYQVLRILGRGGFGITFLAKDITLPYSPLCVIKQLCPKNKDIASLQRARVRFRREAEMLSKLGSHSQIPRLLDYFEIDGEFYLVQEYISGHTIAKDIRLNGPQSESQVKDFLYEILPLLNYIHRNQVIHRDIKPANLIRCDHDGRLVLIDFGAVKEKLGSLEETSNKAPTTQFVGTVGFAAPEQLAMRPIYASDIYALGITCLCLLMGKPPVDLDFDPQTGEVCWQGLVQVSDHFAKILSKMLRVSPKERFQSAEDILRALNLEPYLENLASCLNTQTQVNPKVVPLRQTLKPVSSVASSDYLSPTARTAGAIRGWKSRNQNRDRNCVPFTR